MNYYEFVSRGTSWPLVELSPHLGQVAGGTLDLSIAPNLEGVARAEAVREENATPTGAFDIEVTETKLTDEGILEWTKKLNDLYAALPVDSSQG